MVLVVYGWCLWDRFGVDSNYDTHVHLYNIYHRNKQLPSGLNIARIICEYNSKSCDIQQCNMLTQMNKIYALLVLLVAVLITTITFLYDLTI